MCGERLRGSLLEHHRIIEDKNMNQTIRQKVVVKPGGVINIQSSELPVGSEVDVIIIVEKATQQKQSLRSIIGTGKGSFATPQLADDFISRERDAWSL
jgi:hypothetical protein